MTMIEPATIADVGRTEPTYDARPQIIVEEDRAKRCSGLWRAPSAC